ncbi:DUF2953 domain-containing protein [Vallitalea pronyensis]|uniref:DUF2953 domain-containing protein n=1 Tax=Vallitalea pronyensis TaxID=1348613 RepID=A0A8J8MKH9_9FIRM|nr:DUF2953 domain-containing protein [Vallitalea pronyensis]QUI23164.1 DUF2953 domain-containing protein [Vallitalea pronyensis]
MSVVWFIIKIILWIILSLILLILGLLTFILCAPIRYKVSGEKYEDMKLNVVVTWLCHIISVRYSLENGGKVTVKVFGKIINGEKKEKKKKVKRRRSANNNKRKHPSKSKKDNKLKNNALSNEVVSETPIRQENTEEKIEEDKAKEGTVVKDDKIVTEETIVDVKQADDNVTKQGNAQSVHSEETDAKIKEHRRRKEQKQSKKRKKDNKKDKANQGSIWDKFKRIRSFWQDENNKKVIKFVKKRILLMLKHILPRKFHAKVIIGTGDPATTGYIVGAASILYTVTGDKLQVVPHFSESTIQGDIYVKGRIYLIILVGHALRIILNKRVRQLYKTIKS